MTTHPHQPFTIVGYTYRAENLCPTCVLTAMLWADGDPFNGWGDCSEPPMPTEDNLAEVAAAFGIDRMDEQSFDSSDFPKVIFASMVDDDEQCARCDERLTP